MARTQSEEEKRAEFESVALPHLDRVFTSALYLARDRELAQDLTQETFLRAYRFFHQYQAGTNCRAWLLTILQNTFRNRIRSSRRDRATVDLDDPAAAAQTAAIAAPGGDPAREAVANSLDGEVRTALEALPEDFREVILLVDLQELSYEEAATALDCPIGTVRSRLSRARRLLHDALRDYAARNGLLEHE